MIPSERPSFLDRTNPPAPASRVSCRRPSLMPHGARPCISCLAYMGGSRVCLVESMIQEAVDMECSLVDQDGYWLHVTMFGLKHNHKRELQTTPFVPK
jgi:hypothetical protein